MWRLLVITLGLGLSYYLLFGTATGQQIRPQLIQNIPQIRQRISKIPDIPREILSNSAHLLSPTPTPLSLTAAGLFSAINTARGRSKIVLIKNDQALCSLAQALLQGKPLNNSQITRSCPDCTNVISLVLGNATSSEAAVKNISDSSMSAILTSNNYQRGCAVDDINYISVVTAKIFQPPPTPKPARFISEDELWQALSIYRESHKVSQLQRDDKLCLYARKRLDDQIKLLSENIPKDKYPVPGKFPLDAHEGFKKDADNGYVFETTGRQVVAENLAYYPNAEYGIHVIEWGWDSSTEGHRETQLSTDFSVACLTGKDGFFVAEFGR